MQKIASREEVKAERVWQAKKTSEFGEETNDIVTRGAVTGHGKGNAQITVDSYQNIALER